MRIVLASFLALTLITGCGGIQDQVQTNQKTVTDSERFGAKEYKPDRAFMFNQSNVKHTDLAVRLSNEAERVFNVYEAFAIVQGNNIIMAIATKTDPLRTDAETVRDVRQRLANKEPSLSRYNLYITVDQDLGKEIRRVRTNSENTNTDGYLIHQSEPQFNSILEKIKDQNQ